MPPSLVPVSFGEMFSDFTLMLIFFDLLGALGFLKLCFCLFPNWGFSRPISFKRLWHFLPSSQDSHSTSVQLSVGAPEAFSALSPFQGFNISTVSTTTHLFICLQVYWPPMTFLNFHLCYLFSSKISNVLYLLIFISSIFKHYFKTHYFALSDI